MRGSLLAFVLVMLTGCLEAPQEHVDEDGADGGNGSRDGGSSSWDSDAEPSLTDTGAPSTFFGDYAITWTKIGENCSGPDIAMDRLIVQADSITYSSVGCPAVEPESQPATWSGDQVTVLAIQLENCAQDTYEDLPDHTYVFDGGGLTGYADVVRRRVSDNYNLCLIEYSITGTRI
jgi:hypothetical protein